MLRRLWLLVTLAATACLPTMPAKTFLDRTLTPRVSFDLQCPPEQLQFVDLAGGAIGSQYATHMAMLDGTQYHLEPDVSRQQGVSGCGKRASYTYANGVWVGNGATDLGAAGKASP